MGSFSIWVWFQLFLLVILCIIPAWKILNKCGYSGAWSILYLIPVVGIIALWFFAFKRWPILKTYKSGLAVNGELLNSWSLSFFKMENRQDETKIDIDTINESYRFMSYIQGVTDTYKLRYFLLENIDNNVTFIQIAKIVRQYLDNHPERLNEPASILVLSAMLAAFPPKLKRISRLTNESIKW